LNDVSDVRIVPCESIRSDADGSPNEILYRWFEKIVFGAYAMCIHPLIGSLSKLKNLCARTFFAFVQLSGENPMSHLMSPVFRFQLEAELRLNLCAEPKNMANSALKCHF
jgi:hypothetical protein